MRDMNRAAPLRLPQGFGPASLRRAQPASSELREAEQRQHRWDRVFPWLRQTPEMKFSGSGRDIFFNMRCLPQLPMSRPVSAPFLALKLSHCLSKLPVADASLHAPSLGALPIGWCLQQKSGQPIPSFSCMICQGHSLGNGNDS